jgi:hypothetical protein
LISRPLPDNIEIKYLLSSTSFPESLFGQTDAYAESFIGFEFDESTIRLAPTKIRILRIIQNAVTQAQEKPKGHPSDQIVLAFDRNGILQKIHSRVSFQIIPVGHKHLVEFCKPELKGRSHPSVLDDILKVRIPYPRIKTQPDLVQILLLGIDTEK